MRVPLHDHQLGHGHGAILGDAADIVAPQIQKHAVLCELLFVMQQVIRQSAFFVRRSTSRSCPRNGSNGDSRVLYPHEHLRGRAHEAHPVELQKIQIGRGIQAAQSPVDVEGSRPQSDAESLAEHNLEGISGPDILTDPLHPLLVLLPRRSTLERGIRMGFVGQRKRCG